MIFRANAQIDAGFPAELPKDSIKTNKPFLKTEIHGVVTASGYLQDGVFGMGDGSITMWAGPAQPVADKTFVGGDLRKTWLILKSTAYNLPGGWKAAGRVELDFLGGNVGQGGFADENLLPRVRLAYVEAQKGGSRLRLGQAWTPMVAIFPASVTHFAMAYGSAGSIGFRNPGIFYYQQLAGKAKTRVRLDAAVFKGTWTGDSRDPFGRDEGEKGFPQMELGLNISNFYNKLKWELSVVGHYDRKDLQLPTGEQQLEGSALQVGGKVMYHGLILQGNAYRGRAIGNIWGHLLQFGDIKGHGAWGQAGYKLKSGWSAWFTYGVDDPQDASVLASGNTRLKNRILVPMIKFDAGPLSVAAEWYQAKTQWASNGLPITTRANQFALGTSFTF